MDASVRNEDPEFNDELPPTFAEIEAMPPWLWKWVLRCLVEQIVESVGSVREFYLGAPAWARVILDRILIEEAIEA